MSPTNALKIYSEEAKNWFQKKDFHIFQKAGFDDDN
jgi:hypothetical protein